MSSILKHAIPASYTLLAEATDETVKHHDVFIGKMISIPILFILVFGACYIPHILLKYHKNTLIALCTCLSAGALLGIGLMHVIPEAVEMWEQYNESKEDAATEEDGHDHDHDHEDDGHTHEDDDATNGSSTTVDEHDHDHGGHNHGFGWTFFLCGLVILFLMMTESLLEWWLLRRGSNVHLHTHEGHSHGGHDHNHDGHSHNGAEHSHSHHSHIQPSSAQDSGNCSTEDRHSLVHHDHPQGEHNHHHHHGACETAVESDQAIELAPVTAAPSEVQQHDEAKMNGEEGKENDSIVEPSRKGSNIPPQSGSGEVVIDIAPAGAGTTTTTGTAVAATSAKHQRRAALRHTKRSIDAYVSALAIGLHCLFNGMSLGAMSESHRASFWTFFAASVAHKAFDGFSVGIPVMRAKLGRLVTFLIILIVAASCPLGVVIGYFATRGSSSYLAQAVLMSLSAGSFFYIAIVELIPAGVANKAWLPFRWLAVFVGFGIVSVISIWA